MILYATFANVDAFVSDSGKYPEWEGLSQDEKTEIADHASRDIELTHRQPNENRVPWLIGDPDIQYAAIHQCLHLAKNLDMHELRERVDVATTGSFSDGNVNFTPDGHHLGEYPKRLMITVMEREGILIGTKFNRG